MSLKNHIVTITILLSGICLTGCHSESILDKHTFVCIHSYDESGQDGAYFRSTMQNEFRKQKISADVKHIYLNLVAEEHPAEAYFGGVDQFVNTIRSYDPEVLLINDDLALEYIFNTCDSLLQSQPTVFAGVSSPPHWDRRSYPQLCGLVDKINLAANCEILNHVTGGHSAVIELDFGGYQDRLRRTLFESINDTTRFINNADFLIENLSEDYLNQNYQGLVAVSFLSMEDPESNHMLGTPDEEGILISRRVKTWIPNTTPSQIQVKYDIFSNEIIDTDRRPQFTCIREQFGSEGELNDKKVRTRFLCGYFASVETQIFDQVSLASRILNGTTPSLIPVLYHEQDTYMDWIAMQKCDPPLKYENYKNRFVVINAPFSVKHRNIFIFGTVFISLLFIGGCIFFGLMFLKKRKQAKREQLDELHKEIDKRILALEDLETGFFTLKDRIITFYFGFAQKQGLTDDSIPLEELKWAAHPESLGILREILLDPTEKSKRNRTRIRLDFNGKGWRWWILYFDTLEADKNTIIGSIINIDDVVNLESQAWEAALKAEEVLSKENFIANITHDIRTPLNAIIGFSELLLDPDHDAEERQEFMDIISTNTDQMINLLEEAAVMQSDSTESMSFKIREIDFTKLVDDSYKTNKILCPQHLTFIYEPSEQRGIMVRCDSVRTSQVINNFLSNAFKYTPSGSVTFGWRLTENDTMVEVYVKDTGVGISEEDKKVIGERFGMAKGNRKGTGLGLDICQKIIYAQKGVYGFESELGVGSCFHFSLPVIINQENDGKL